MEAAESETNGLVLKYGWTLQKMFCPGQELSIGRKTKLQKNQSTTVPNTPLKVCNHCFAMLRRDWAS